MSMNRQEWCDGLREVADFIEAHPDFSPDFLCPFDLAAFAFGRDDFAELVRVLGGGDKGTTGSYFEVARRFGPHKITANAPRAQVCERVVIGTEEVEVPDPDAPKITVEQEQVEWRCPDSILRLTEQEQAA